METGEIVTTQLSIYPMYRGDRQTIGRQIARLIIVEKKCKKDDEGWKKWPGARSFEGGVENRRDHEGKEKKEVERKENKE